MSEDVKEAVDNSASRAMAIALGKKVNREQLRMYFTGFVKKDGAFSEEGFNKLRRMSVRQDWTATLDRFARTFKIA